ncbi:phenolic acid decarboxylase [Mycobacterium sp. 852002-51057_SCH5723018]|uniref:phenolic acid decarboxylase n=1 Tax=Mycobacterium sp. 852002-51057_SCH5723018 TaxID=1834094 RepID=UPI003510881D
MHGTIFFPRWIEEGGSKTVLFQNDHLDLMRAYRDEGPTYPIAVVPEFAHISFMEYVGTDEQRHFRCARLLPAGYADGTN